ncbi:SRTD2 protein, partial [Polyodon spathula]|nr:SRTD2 protein [Polyodon spathula]
MLGRGVKRKLSDYDESMAAGPPGPFDSSPALPYPQQRQLVLNMCLSKLQSCCLKVEPSLHRSVLLSNTLRQIQGEMLNEDCSTSPLTVQSDGSSYSADTNPAATPAHIPDLPPLPCYSQAEEANLMTVPSDNKMSSTESSHLRVAGFVKDTSPPPACPSWAENEELDFFSSSSSSSEDEGNDHLAGSRSLDSLFGSFEMPNSTSYLTDLAFDDIFEDIDTSMYDSSDFNSVLSFTAHCSSVSPTEDSLKPFSTCTSLSTNGIQICITDLNDLDHIMEILVES